MTDRKAAARNKPILCQRCHTKDATHSILSKILLCKSCYEATFQTQASLDMEQARAHYWGEEYRHVTSFAEAQAIYFRRNGR